MGQRAHPFSPLQILQILLLDLPHPLSDLTVVTLGQPHTSVILRGSRRESVLVEKLRFPPNTRTTARSSPPTLKTLTSSQFAPSSRAHSAMSPSFQGKLPCFFPSTREGYPPQLHPASPCAAPLGCRTVQPVTSNGPPRLLPPHRNTCSPRPQPPLPTCPPASTKNLPNRGCICRHDMSCRVAALYPVCSCGNVP